MPNKTSYATNKEIMPTAISYPVHVHTEDCWQSLNKDCVEHHIRKRDAALFTARAKIAKWQLALREVQGMAVKSDNEMKMYLAE